MTIRSRDLQPGDVLATPRRGASPCTIKERKADDTGWWMVDTGGLADRVFDDPHFGWHRIWSAAKPTDVLVNVTDLEIIRAGFVDGECQEGPVLVALRRVLDRIPEWVPTEEQIVGLAKAYDTPPVRPALINLLKGMHREGLIS